MVAAAADSSAGAFNMFTKNGNYGLRDLAIPLIYTSTLCLSCHK